MSAGKQGKQSHEMEQIINITNCIDRTLASYNTQVQKSGGGGRIYLMYCIVDWVRAPPPPPPPFGEVSKKYNELLHPPLTPPILHDHDSRSYSSSTDFV